MIKITTDSTCDLPRHILEDLDVSVTPLGVIKAGKLYHDGVDIRTADIVAHVDGGGEITTTNAVNAADYLDLFRSLMERYDAVIHINIGMGFSCCYQNAKLAAEEVPGVYVVDSANLTVGHGLLVMAAAEAARDGKSAWEIVAMLEEMLPRIETSFVLDRLDYMKKGGRCSTATALGASLLKLHPCLEVVDGKLPVVKKYRGSIEKVVADYVRDRLDYMKKGGRCSAVTALGANLLKLHPCLEVIDGKLSVVKKYRGSIEKVVADYVRERLQNAGDVVTSRMWMVDTCEDDHLASIARDILRADGRFGEILEAKAGCTIFCHCGPGTLGLVFLRK